MAIDISKTVVECIFLLETIRINEAGNMGDAYRAREGLSLTQISSANDIIQCSNDSTRYALTRNRLEIADRSDLPLDKRPISEWVTYLFQGFPSEKLKGYGINLRGLFSTGKEEVGVIQLLERFPIKKPGISDDPLRGIGIQLFFGDFDGDYYDIRFSNDDVKSKDLGYHFHFHYDRSYKVVDEFIKDFNKTYEHASRKQLEYINALVGS